MNHMTFESIAAAGGAEVLVINGEAAARGIWIPEAVAMLRDWQTDAQSYPDTGVFVLFRGSPARGADEAARQYLDENGRTTREFILQSRNAAARFVLGPDGGTGSWKAEA